VRNDDDVRRSWQALDMMAGPGRPLDAVTEGNLYAALAIARRSNAVTAGRLEILDRYMKTLLSPDFAQVDPVNPPLRGRRTICDPLSREGISSYGSLPSTVQSPAR
jgi:hypothetical protein